MSTLSPDNKPTGASNASVVMTTRTPKKKSRRAYPLRNWQRPMRDWLFERIHGNKLVYNTCWEDPRCDRAMLDFQADSEIVMITSAGDNALDYLLDNPHRVHSIDVNPRQNALLHLKRAGFQELEWEAFFRLFGDGACTQAEIHYQEDLRDCLPPASQQYWDKQLSYFSPKGKRDSLYYHGSSGYFAWVAGRLLRRKTKLFRGATTISGFLPITHGCWHNTLSLVK
ncbi:MAG: DUF3419 family protein, partial [Bacteroidota bacterium]